MLYTWIRAGGCGWPISLNAFIMGTDSLYLMYVIPTSASTTDTMDTLRMFYVVCNSPFSGGMVSGGKCWLVGVYLLKDSLLLCFWSLRRISIKYCYEYTVPCQIHSILLLLIGY